VEIDSAYVTPQGLTESEKSYRRRIYNILVTFLQAEANARGMSIEKLWPDTNWKRAWKTLWETPVPDSVKETWYRIIHNILPTRERLHNIVYPQLISAACATKIKTHWHIVSLNVVRGATNEHGRDSVWRS
jgi:hypothetical protein